MKDEIKIRIVGDVHGEDWWKEVISDIEDIDSCVFLGDYVDSFTVKDDAMINNLKDIIQFKDSYPEKVNLLIGNHDIQYMFLNQFRGYCSGFRPSCCGILHEVFKENESKFQVSFLSIFNNISPILFTHAGVSNGWINQKRVRDNINPFDAVNLNTFLNEGMDSINRLHIINEVSRTRGGSFRYGGALWADRSETYIDYLLDFPLHQVVGHTRTNHQLPLFYVSKDKSSSITYCDLATKGDILMTLKDSSINVRYCNKQEYYFNKLVC